MKQALLVVVAVIGLAALMIAARLWMTPDLTPEVSIQSEAPAADSAPVAPMFGSVVADETVISDALEDELLPAGTEPEEEMVWTPDPDAVASLRESRLHGDPRTPPIARPEREREMPTAEELADPDLYLEYEARQQQQVYASFVQASERKIAELEAIIEQGRQGGVSEEQLAEGLEKLEGLKAMREQLIAENPELADGAATDDGGEEAAPATP